MGLDHNSALFLSLLAAKEWLPTLFYVAGLYYIYKKTRSKK